MLLAATHKDSREGIMLDDCRGALFSRVFISLLLVMVLRLVAGVAHWAIDPKTCFQVAISSFCCFSKAPLFNVAWS